MWFLQLLGLTALVGVVLGFGLRGFDIVVENVKRRRELAREAEANKTE
jgi:hypothetical protein